MQAFAAGADIKEMQNRDFASNYRENFLGKLLLFGRAQILTSFSWIARNL
jgi:hypothetical protein